MLIPGKNPTDSNRRWFFQVASASMALVSTSTVSGSTNAEATGTTATGDGVGKKGFCCVTKDGSGWRDKIQALQANWFYSWSSSMPGDVPDGIEFTPMTWGKLGKKSDAMFAKLRQQRDESQISALMGFNEPDKKNQSNITVNEALAMWPRLMELGLPLASPGCVHPDNQWMKDFMKGVQERELRVDFVCVHSYGGPNANGLMNRLSRIHKMYGRPIWITEFAVGDWAAKSAQKNKHRPKQIATFMREILPMLERADFVERYAWYSAKPDNWALGTSALFDAQGRLTELGKIYRDA